MQAAVCQTAAALHTRHCCFCRPTFSSASCHLMLRCRYNLRVRLYRPRSASLLQTFTSWLTGMPAEFSDPKFPSYGEGREGEIRAALCRSSSSSAGSGVCGLAASCLARGMGADAPCMHPPHSRLYAVTRVVSSGHVNISQKSTYSQK